MVCTERQTDWTGLPANAKTAIAPARTLHGIVRLTLAVSLLIGSHVILAASASSRGYGSLMMLLGWGLCGTALFALSCTAQTCATGAFSSSKTANRLLGWIAAAPLLLPYEHWAAPVQKTRRAATLSSLANSYWFWWLASWVEWADASTSCGGSTSKPMRPHKSLHHPSSTGPNSVEISDEGKLKQECSDLKLKLELEPDQDLDQGLTGRAQQECTALTNVLVLYGFAAALIWFFCTTFGVSAALLMVGKYFVIPWMIYHLWRSIAISVTLSKEAVSLRVAVLEGSQALQAASALKRAWLNAGQSRDSSGTSMNFLQQADMFETAMGRFADLQLECLGRQVGSRRRALLKAVFGDGAVAPEWVWHPSAQVDKILQLSRGFTHLPDAHMPTEHDTAPANEVEQHQSESSNKTQQLSMNWFNIIMISILHAGALYGLIGCGPKADYRTIVLTFILYQLSGLGITAGAHRLWAHKSYSAHASVRAVLSIFNAMAYQGSIYEWARHHRVHHRHSDTEADPHNSGRGFWYSHVGWILQNPPDAVVRAARKTKLKDLEADSIVMWQHKHYPVLALVSCFVLPTAVAALGWGDAWGGFWLGGCFRLVWVWHMTWLVNSAAHAFGNRPYLSSIKPVQNWLVSLGAMGEGWHNYHHAFPHDYSANEHGWTGEWNPTTLFIDTLAALGLVWNRTKANAHPVDRSQLPSWTMADLAREIEMEPALAKEEGRSQRMLLILDDLDNTHANCDAATRMPKLVIDAAPFQDAHPGGAAVLKRLVGKDATEAFAAVKHSPEAQHMVYSMQVAELLPEVTMQPHSDAALPAGDSCIPVDHIQTRSLLHSNESDIYRMGPPCMQAGLKVIKETGEDEDSGCEMAHPANFGTTKIKNE